MDVCLCFVFSAQELVVRLAAIWGDLTAAFGLPTRDVGSEDEHGTWPVALRASKLSVKSMALHLGAFSRYQQEFQVSRVQLWSFTFFTCPKSKAWFEVQHASSAQVEAPHYEARSLFGMKRGRWLIMLEVKGENN